MSDTKSILRSLIAALTILILGVTFLAQIASDEWWIRFWDFPRLQLLVLGGVVLAWWLGALLFRRRRDALTLLMIGMAATVVAVQAAKVVRFSPVWSPEVNLVAVQEPERCVRLLVSNVKMANRQSEKLREVLNREDPDIVLILENDKWWSEELATIADRYPDVIDQPQDNTYGMLFMTRLTVKQLSLRFLTEPTIPSIRATLMVSGGSPFIFYGVHPPPPRIGQDSDLRDQELIVVARQMRNDGGPSIVGGDLNDVAWSQTTQRFKEISGALDPRVGRGIYSTFHADHWFARWPLDHIFHTREFSLASLQVLERVGSDHFPVSSTLCMAGDAVNTRLHGRLLP